MKLQPKIALTLIASMALAIFISFALMNAGVALLDRSYSWHDLEKVAVEAARDLGAAGVLDAGTAAEKLSAWKGRYPNLFFTLFDEKRELIFATDERPRRRPEIIEEIRRRMAEEEKRAAASSGSLRFVDTMDRAPYMVMKPVIGGEKIRGMLSVSVRRDFFLPFYIRVNDEKIVDSYLILFGALASVIALSFLFVILFTAPLVRRLRGLYAGMNAFELGRPAAPAPDPGRDEIGSIRRTFDRMAERIHASYAERERIFHERQALLRNISHDFRTPLTSILGYAASLEEGVHETEEERRQCYVIIRKKAEYMTRLFNEMMELTRLESGGDALKREPFNLGELVREILIEYLPQLETMGFIVETAIPETLPCAGDRERLSRLVRNLVDNVVTHAAAGRSLAVRCSALSEQGAPPGIVIEVADRGPGVAAEHRARIFERFYSAAAANAGSGLGLAIAREIVEKHGGTIGLPPADGPGCVFRVFLPQPEGSAAAG